MSLATKVNERIGLFLTGQQPGEVPKDLKKRPKAEARGDRTSPEQELGNLVGSKIEEFNVKGAIRIAASDEKIADSSDPKVIQELKDNTLILCNQNRQKQYH